MALDLEQYLSAVRKFNQLVSELADKLEQINDARDEALRASAELQKEMDANNQKLVDMGSSVRQQVLSEFIKKGPRSDETSGPAAGRRVS